MSERYRLDKGNTPDLIHFLVVTLRVFLACFNPMCHLWLSISGPENYSPNKGSRRRFSGSHAGRSRAGNTRATAMSINSGSAEDEWYTELGAVESQMNRNMGTARVGANAFDVTTVYMVETESCRKPSPTKKQKKAPSSGSVVSARTTKSFRSTAKSTVTTRSSSSKRSSDGDKKLPAKPSPTSPSASTRSKRRAERENKEEEEWESECAGAPGASESEDEDL